MQVPAIFYGSYRDVRKATKLLAQAFVDGSPVKELVETTVESRELPGVMILDEPQSALRAGPHFFFDTVATWLLDLQRRVDPRAWSRFYEWALSRPGSFPTVLGQAGVSYMFEESAYESRFIQAGLLYWAELAAEGPRYVMRVSPGVSEDLWALPNGVKKALMGASGRNDWVFDPLPAGGLSELLEKLGVNIGQAG